MQYSALTQINRSNVGTLQQAWFYPVEDDAVRIEFNPLIVDEVMYVRGAKGRLVALDAATGKEIWRSTEEAFDRGVSYWESPDRTDRRLMVTSQTSACGRSTRAPDKLITTFGVDGTVDMRSGSPRRLRRPQQNARPDLPEPRHRRLADGRRLRLAPRRHPRLRRADRHTGVDLPHRAPPR